MIPPGRRNMRASSPRSWRDEAEARGKASAARDSALRRRHTTLMKRFYLDGPFGQIHGRRVGEGPPVLLLHQSPLSARQFAKAMPYLARAGFEAIAIDTPGLGGSDPSPAPPTIENFALAPLAVMEALSLSRAHVVGHHTGATIAGCFAARHPARVDRLVLHGYPLLTQAEIDHFLAFGLGPLQLREDGAHLLEVWERRLKVSPGWTDLEMMHDAVMDDLAAWRTAWHGHDAVFRHPHAPDLAAIQAPTLLLSNTGDDLHQPMQHVRAARPDFDYVALEGGNHDFIELQAEAWAQAVVRFLAAAQGN